ncbi:MAG: MlaE family ABC transporter permease, partial [Bdellovibrionota bacterium]
MAVGIAELIQSSIILLGDFSLFVFDTLRSWKALWRRRGLFLFQCEFIGVGSIGVVTVAAIFMGAVLAYQLYVVFHRFGAEGFLGGSVGVSLFKELGPVMAAIMVTGRAGA